MGRAARMSGLETSTRTDAPGRRFDRADSAPPRTAPQDLAAERKRLRNPVRSRVPRPRRRAPRQRPRDGSPRTGQHRGPVRLAVHALLERQPSVRSGHSTAPARPRPIKRSKRRLAASEARRIGAHGLRNCLGWWLSCQPSTAMSGEERRQPGEDPHRRPARAPCAPQHPRDVPHPAAAGHPGPALIAKAIDHGERSGRLTAFPGRRATTRTQCAAREESPANRSGIEKALFPGLFP